MREVKWEQVYAGVWRVEARDAPNQVASLTKN